MKLIVLSALAVTFLHGADMTGTWVGQMSVRKNQFKDVAIKLVQNGTGITGKLYGDYQSSPIAEGRVTGEEVSFLVIVAEQAGNEINQTRHRFTGSIKDGHLEMMRVREGARSSGNGAEVHFKGESKISFILKRLY